MIRKSTYSIIKTVNPLARALLFLLLVTSFVQAQKGLKGNATSVILTPPLEIQYTLGGYGERMSRPAEAIHDDLKAKALVLKDDEKKYALITLDVTGLPPNLRHVVAQKLSGSGWTEKNLLFLPSHTHTGLEMFAMNDKNIFGNPAIGIFQPELLEYVADKLASLILETDKDLRPVLIGTGQVILEGLNRNRRGDQSVDRELTVTRIDLLDGKPMAVLVNWTAHPTIMSGKDMWVSGGWPGYMQRELETWIGSDVVALYYNGAEGDQSVIARKGGSHYEKAEYYGREMATHALKVYEQISPKMDNRLAFHYQAFELPKKKPHPSFMNTGGDEYMLDEEKIQGLLEQVLPGSATISSCRIGDLLIVGAPGEMIAELGLGIKSKLRQAGIPYPVIGGLANEWISYILTEKEYHESGYETSVSFYGPTLGKLIQDEMINAALHLK